MLVPAPFVRQSDQERTVGSRVSRRSEGHCGSLQAVSQARGSTPVLRDGSEPPTPRSGGAGPALPKGAPRYAMSPKFLYYVSDTKVKLLTGQLRPRTRLSRLRARGSAFGLGAELELGREETHDGDAALARDVTDLVKRMLKSEDVLQTLGRRVPPLTRQRTRRLLRHRARRVADEQSRNGVQDLPRAPGIESHRSIRRRVRRLARYTALE
jgi:hypothetical protein